MKYCVSCAFIIFPVPLWLNRHDTAIACLHPFTSGCAGNEIYAQTWSIIPKNGNCCISPEVFGTVSSSRHFRTGVRLSLSTSVLWLSDFFSLRLQILAYAGFHTIIWPQWAALEAPSEFMTDKHTLFRVIIHCQQRASKDNCRLFKKDNSGYYAASVIDYSWSAGHSKLICFTCKVRRKGEKCRCCGEDLLWNMNKWWPVTSDNLIITGCTVCKLCLDAFLWYTSAFWGKRMMNWF